ncbi:hypothetical protein H6F76_02010 [Leptolyngbya sp. FACHB-321]|uniref:hypothetical protein n=1 Tax=Leptolyngbya sp. FACHB-321 TaxID=2692807 RepID=UPI0016899047|nr:hypothetical protein [Leptolyngbya sp. FACHB-321]MBD2033835.1 hypothetical protein [Leptolyngbya sp. FACHB-321]
MDVESALANKQFDLAQQAITNAQAVWNRWRKGRNDWVIQLEYQQSLLNKSSTVDPEMPYMQIVRAQLEDVGRAAVDQDSPVTLRNILQEIQQKLNHYLQGKSQLDELNQMRRNLVPDHDRVWGQAVLQLEQQLSQLSPDAVEAVKEWQASVSSARQRLFEELQQGEAAPASRDSVSINTQYLKPVPAVQPFSSENEVRTSRRRLRGANTLSYGIIVGLLAIAGFNQLYLSNPVFGASIGDYFLLLAWGFGAEATSESIAKVMQRWGLPGNQ